MKKKEARKKCKRFDSLIILMSVICISSLFLTIFFAFFDSKLCLLLSVTYKILGALAFGVLVWCSLIIDPAYRENSRKHILEGDPEDEVDEYDMDFL